MISGDSLLVDVGEKAPDFTLPSNSGDNVSLSKGEKDCSVFLPKRRNVRMLP